MGRFILIALFVVSPLSIHYETNEQYIEITTINADLVSVFVLSWSADNYPTCQGTKDRITCVLTSNYSTMDIVIRPKNTCLESIVLVDDSPVDTQKPLYEETCLYLGVLWK